MQYASLMIDVETKKVLQKVQERVNEKFGGKHSYSEIISEALYQYAKTESLKL